MNHLMLSPYLCSKLSQRIQRENLKTNLDKSKIDGTFFNANDSEGFSSQFKSSPPFFLVFLFSMPVTVNKSVDKV